MEAVFKCEFPVEVHGDNSTATLDMETGKTKAMRHLLKHHRVSLGLLHDVLDRENIQIGQVDSAWNTPEVLGTTPDDSNKIY